MGLGALPPKCRQLVPVVEGQDVRKIKPRPGVIRHPGLEPRPSLDKRQLADVVLAVEQHVIYTDKGRIVAKMRFRRGLAVQPLLQIVERHGLEPAPDQKFPVKNSPAPKRVGKVGEGGADVIAGP